MKYLLAAMMAAGAIAAPTVGSAAARTPVSVTVSVAKVDTTDAMQVHRLVNSINRQIEDACAPASDEIGVMGYDHKCHREMMASLGPQLRRLMSGGRVVVEN